MIPILFSSCGFGLSSYTAFLSFACIIGLASALLLRRVLDPGVEFTALGAVPMFIGALFGARLFWILQYGSPYDVWRALFFWEGGWVFYGGFVGGLIGVAGYLRFVGTGIVRGYDVLAPALALGIAITRVGCFLNGCCWGEITDVPWAVRYPMKLTPVVFDHYQRGLLTPDSISTLPVHPVQLYNVSTNLVLFFVCLVALKRKRYDGQVSLTFLCGYGFFRFITEFFRGDSPEFLSGMTLSQVISLGLFLLGSGLLFARAVKGTVHH